MLQLGQGSFFVGLKMFGIDIYLSGPQNCARRNTAEFPAPSTHQVPSFVKPDDWREAGVSS